MKKRDINELEYVAYKKKGKSMMKFVLYESLMILFAFIF